MCKGDTSFHVVLQPSPLILVTSKLSSNIHFSGDHSSEHIKFPNFSSRADKISVIHQRDWEIDPPARPGRQTELCQSAKSTVG